MMKVMATMVQLGKSELIYSTQKFPEDIKEGESTEMSCRYEMGPNRILKWYKDMGEFYTYDPFDYGLQKNHPDLPFGSLKIQNQGQTIILTNVTQKMEGVYECEITEETGHKNPTFMTEKMEAKLKVIPRPKENRLLEGSCYKRQMTLTCQVKSWGYTFVKFSWYRDNWILPISMSTQSLPIKNITTIKMENNQLQIDKSDNIKCMVELHFPGANSRVSKNNSEKVETNSSSQDMDKESSNEGKEHVNMTFHCKNKNSPYTESNHPQASKHTVTQMKIILIITKVLLRQD